MDVVPAPASPPEFRPGDHTDDLEPRPRLALTASRERADPCAHGIRADLAHERLVDHSRPVRRPGIRRLQATAGYDPGVERLVIAGTDRQHPESAFVVAMEASRWCAALLHFERYPVRLRSQHTIGEHHVGHTRLLTQPARELFVCPRAPRANLPIVRHTALASRRLVVHPEAEREVTLRRKRCPRRLVLKGVGVDPDRGRHDEQRERHLRADDERPDAAELYRSAGAGDPLQSPLDRRARRLQCRQQADQCGGDEREQQRVRDGGRLEPQIHPERQAVPNDLTRPGPGIAHRRLGDDEPEHGSGESQHEPFGDDLRDHAGTARAQCVPDDDLRFAHRRAREDQRRDVRRHRPQQQQDDGVDRQIFQPQRITRRAPGECANARPQLRVGRRLVGGKACRDDVELRRGVLPARSVGEAAEHLHGRPFSRRRVLDRQWHPDLLIAREAEARRHHAHHGASRAAHRHDAADDRRVVEELSLPDVVTQNDDGLRTRHFVGRLQRPAEQRRDAGERKRRRRDLRHAQRFDTAFAREHVALAQAGGAELGHRLQRRRQIAKSWSTLGSTRDATMSCVSRLTTRPPSVERQPFVQQFAGDFDADRANRDGTRQREAADDRERGIFHQQTRAQLPVEPRDRGQRTATGSTWCITHGCHRALPLKHPCWVQTRLAFICFDPLARIGSRSSLYNTKFSV